MENNDLDYGAFVSKKASPVTEHLETLEEASPIETTEHLQRQEEVRKLKQAEIEAERENNLKKLRIAAVKKARIEAVKRAKAAKLEEEKTPEEEAVLQEKSDSVVFDWEVPFMDEPSGKTEKKSRKSRKSKTEKKAEKKAKKSQKISKKEAGKAAVKTSVVKVSAAEKPVKVKVSIGAKLIGIISLILVFSLSGLTYLVSYFISADTRVNAEENNLTINDRTASDTNNRISTVISNTGMLFDILDGNFENLSEVNKNTSSFFERNKEVAAVYLPDSQRAFYNKTYLLSHEIEQTQILSYFEGESESVEASAGGTYLMENASPYFQQPLIAIFYPLSAFEEDTCAAVLYSSEALADSISSSSVNMSCLVNSNGVVLVHSDIELMMNAGDMSENPLVLQMLSDNNTSEQIYYKNASGEEYIGAYKKLNNFNCGVLTTVPTEVVLEAVNSTTRRNIYLTIATLSLAIMIIWFFSKSMSIPLKALTKVTNEINQGNFDTVLLDELNSKRHDEIGVLVGSTKHEQDILTTFSHLTNLAVTKAVIRKEIDFDAHLKDITIFFSDIRGFTAISDGFSKRFGEKSAGEIISFLNDYMSRMVNCISITGGNVDKFEGDAIMACWGVLRNDNLDYELLPDTDPEKQKLKEIHEKHIKEDAVNALKAVVAMRYALMKYNKDAEIFTKAHEKDALAQYKPHIRIGCGLNSGRATVGFMGSYDKMEFTSIGDSVNLASRTEASTKPCGVDGLITEDTYNLIKMDYIRCEENNFTLKPENEANEIIVEQIPVTFEVKGKGKQHFYGIVNMPHLDIKEFFRTADPEFEPDYDCVNCVGPGGPKTLDEVRNILGIPIPDFSGVDLDKEENKSQITTA